MKLPASASALLLAAAAAASPALESPNPNLDLDLDLDLTSPHLFHNSPSSPAATSSHQDRRIPTSYESAVLGRRILALTPLGTLSTVFPHSSSSSSLAGAPIGLTEYVADCEPDEAGNPTLLAIRIATSFRNAAAGSNVSLSLQWTPPYPPSKRISSSETSSFWESLSSFLLPSGAGEEKPPKGGMPYSAANLPRFSLLGYLETINTTTSSSASDGLSECFTATHPDARYWLPGNRIHAASWARLVVQRVYWVGGFGDRAYIGWIPAAEWAAVSRAEWEAVRLPGEKPGWKEWDAAAYGAEYDL